MCSPWSGETGAAGVQIRQLLLDLVRVLQSQDFRYGQPQVGMIQITSRFVANINFKGSLDSFFFEARRSLSFGLATPEQMFAVRSEVRIGRVTAPRSV